MRSCLRWLTIIVTSSTLAGASVGAQQSQLPAADVETIKKDVTTAVDNRTVASHRFRDTLSVTTAAV